MKILINQLLKTTVYVTIFTVFRTTNVLDPIAFQFILHLCQRDNPKLSKDLVVEINGASKSIKIEALIGMGACGIVYSLANNPKLFPSKMAIKFFAERSDYEKEVEVLKQIRLKMQNPPFFFLGQFVTRAML